jgi:hypothetical protein
LNICGAEDHVPLNSIAKPEPTGLEGEVAFRFKDFLGFNGEGSFGFLGVRETRAE